MTRQPERLLLNYLASYDPRIANLALALRGIVLEEAPDAIESLVNGYAVAIGFSFTGKPLKDGFCHIVIYKNCVNLGFNRGALLDDPDGVLQGSGKLIRHLRVHNCDELDRPLMRRFLRVAIGQVRGPSKERASNKTKSDPRPARPGRAK